MAIARRDFLKVVGGASVAGSLSGYGAQALAAIPDSLAFGFTDDNVPMSNAVKRYDRACALCTGTRSFA
jgi:hypothetical protein